MPVVFAGIPGRVIALKDPTVVGMLPLVQADPPVNFQQHKALITRLAVSSETNHQFLHSLGGSVFIYVFGDRIGQLTISGLAVARDCDRPGGVDRSGDNDHGIERIFDWYNQNRLSRRRSPVTVLVGRRTTIRGFVGGVQASVFDHRLHLVQFDLLMFVVPQRGSGV